MATLGVVSSSVPPSSSTRFSSTSMCMGSCSRCSTFERDGNFLQHERLRGLPISSTHPEDAGGGNRPSVCPIRGTGSPDIAALHRRAGPVDLANDGGFGQYARSLLEAGRGDERVGRK